MPVAKGEKDFSHSLLVAITAASFASACVMAIEIAAGRLMAMNYGASLPCWTTVIGVVLGGLSFGNYLGGRLADYLPIRRTISRLFLMASISCIVMIRLQHGGLQFDWIMEQNWQTRILLHATLLFLLPSTVLGMVGPLAGKLALSTHGKIGRIVGSLYAFSTLGSILGTFLTGFYLIRAIGVNGVIWGACLSSALGAIMIDTNRRLPVFWACLAGVLGVLALGPWSWTVDAGVVLSMRNPKDENILFLQDSSYSRVAVVELADEPGSRYMYLDILLHSKLFIGEPDHLLYDYEQIYAALTARFSKGKDRLKTLTLGGGGYVFPMFLNRHWPNSHVEVVEIDPLVTAAAEKTFGMHRDGSIKIHHLDARNHVEDLYRKKIAGQPVPEYNFIYCDAYNHYAVPYHLTTVEFVQKIRELLADDGLYFANIIDNFVPGSFAGSVLKTMDRVFPFVYAVSPEMDFQEVRNGGRTTVVVIGSMHALDLGHLELPPQVSETGIMCRSLPQSTLDSLRSREATTVLTDDYAPVDRLMAHLHATDESGNFIRHYNRGAKLTAAGDTEGAIEEFLKVLKMNPSHVQSMNSLGVIFATTNQMPQALNAFRQALALEPRNYKVLSNHGIALMSMNKYREAIKDFQKSIAIKPDYPDAHFNLGHALLNLKDYSGAAKAWRNGLESNPDDIGLTGNLSRLLATCPDETLRNGKEAVALARRVLVQMEGPDARSLDTLGVALAEAGDFDQAIQVTEQALQLSTTSPTDETLSPENRASRERLKDRMIEHIHSYKEKNPIRLDGSSLPPG